MTKILHRLLSESNLFEPSEDTIQNWMNAFEKFSQNKEVLGKSLKLIRLIYSLGSESDFIDEFRQMLIEFDSSFPARGGNYQLKILAFALLDYLIESDSLSIGASLSLALVNCFGFGLRERFNRIDIPSLSEGFLEKQFLREREFKGTETDFAFSLNAAKLEELMPSQLVPESIGEIRELFGEIVTALDNFSIKLNQGFSNVNKKEQILKDESNILWWLFSGKSKVFQKPWSEVRALEAYLVVGQELSDQVKIIPGPRSYQEIIKKVLDCFHEAPPRSITAKNMISDAPKKWKETVVKLSEAHISDLTPIHYMIMKSLELKSDGKFDKCVKDAKINIKKSLSPQHFATQMYRESVYIKSLQNIGE